MKGKKSVIIAVAVLVIIAAIGIGVGVHNHNIPDEPAEVEQKTDVNEEKDESPEGEKVEDKSSESDSDEADKTEEIIKETPVFMYFVSESDSNYNEAIEVFEELKKEYEGKVDFDLKNVTQDPELLENFSLVKDNTPALIMDGKTGITGFQFKMTDKKILAEEIEKSLK